MNNWILVIVLTMWAGILHYMHKLTSQLTDLEKEVEELKKDKS